jgi:hypothetical protein
VDPRAESVQRFWSISVQMPRSISFGPSRNDLIYLLDYWLSPSRDLDRILETSGEASRHFLAHLIVRRYGVCCTLSVSIENISDYREDDQMRGYSIEIPLMIRLISSLSDDACEYCQGVLRIPIRNFCAIQPRNFDSALRTHESPLSIYLQWI